MAYFSVDLQNKERAQLVVERETMPLPDRRSIRLRGYDYTSAGLYFVTLCVTGRECILGTVREGVVSLSPLGRMVDLRWQKLPGIFPNLSLDDYVVMPNHLHAILYLAPAETEAAIPTEQRAPDLFTSARPHGTRRRSLAAAIQSFKSTTTRALKSKLEGNRPWQRNYH